jgi:lipid-binding SYLF domain-containing protein
MLKLVLAAAASLVLATAPAAAMSKREKAERLVAQAAETTAYFAEDSAFGALRDTADNAKAMVIIPRQLRGGFLVGASGGNAVMIARGENGQWTQPVFFTVGSLSFGFQVGAEASEIVLLVMTQRGMEHLLSTTVKLGGDVTLAAGPVGAGAKAQTTDILAFSRSRGLYGGISLEGALLKARHSWNEAYYGAAVKPVDIIYRNGAYNPRSASLQQAVTSLSDGGVTRVAPLQPVQQAPVPLQSAPKPGQPPAQYEDDAVWGEKVNPQPNQ